MNQVKWSNEELATNFVFPTSISPVEKKEADELLMVELRQRRLIQQKGTQLKMQLLQLRFEIEQCVEIPVFDQELSFGHFLKNYIECLKIKRNAFAEEINIKPVELSQYINNHRKPPQYILIRLELHSNNIIPANYWYRLIDKAYLNELETNLDLRNKERKFIKNGAKVA